jgi:hypothetical protein
MDGFWDAVDICGFSILVSLDCLTRGTTGSKGLIILKSNWIELLLMEVSVICLEIQRSGMYKQLNQIIVA